MPEASPYTVELDVPISVPTEPEVDLLFDLAVNADQGQHDLTMHCPITNTVFLCPEQFSGSHTPAPLTLTPETGHVAEWEDVVVGVSGNTYKMSVGGTDAAPITSYVATPPLDANTPIVITFYCYGMTGATGTYQVANFRLSDGPELVIASDGMCYVSDGSDWMPQGSISGDYRQGGIGRDSITGRWVRILLMPLNRRDLLVMSDLGGAWVYRRSELDIGETNNEIIPDGSVIIMFPSSKGLVQVQKAEFPASGTYFSAVLDIGYAPRPGRSVTPLAYADLAGGTVTMTLVKEDGSAYTPDGATRKVRAKFVIQRGTTLNSTPLLYAGAATIEGARQDREGTATESPHRATVIQHNSVEMVIDSYDGAPHTDGWPTGVRAGRSVAVKDGSANELFIGVFGAPVLEGAQAPAAKLTATSLWQCMEQAKFRSTWRFDWLLDSEVIKKCARLAGIPDARMEISEGQTVLGDPRGKKSCFVVPAGKSAAEVAREVADLWSNWVLDVRQIGGVQKLFYGPPPTGASVKTFYRSHLSAGWQNCYWSNVQLVKTTRINDGTAWNEVVIRGVDPDGAELSATSYDGTAGDAQDPALTEEERPENWYGAPVVKVIEDSRLCTQDAVDYVCAVMKERYIEQVPRAIWIADFDETLSVGSIVTLESRGTYRIIDMKPAVDPYDVGQHWYRPTRYLGELI